MTQNADTAGRDIADSVADVGRSRWWAVAAGALSVIAGVVALTWPGATVAFLAVVFAIQLFVLGIFRVVAAFAVPETSTGERILSVVLGILSIIVGVLCLRAPLQTVVVLTLVLGLFWLIHGVADIVNGISAKGRPGRAWTIVSGVVGVLGGIVVLSAPVGSAVALAWLLGVLLVVQGFVWIVGAFGRGEASTTSSAAPTGLGATPA